LPGRSERQEVKLFPIARGGVAAQCRGQGGPGDRARDGAEQRRAVLASGHVGVVELPVAALFDIAEVGARGLVLTLGVE
jgi:hypothetical protein